jgi:hypothetical protein
LPPEPALGFSEPCNLSVAPTGVRRALSMKLWDIIRSELFSWCSEIISGGKTPGWPRVVINFMCLGCNHHSEKKGWGVGMIDDGPEGDGLWNCFYIISSFDRWQKFRDNFLASAQNKQIP